MATHKKRDRRDGWEAKRRQPEDPVPADVWAALRRERQQLERMEGKDAR